MEVKNNLKLIFSYFKLNLKKDEVLIKIDDNAPQRKILSELSKKLKELKKMYQDEKTQVFVYRPDSCTVHLRDIKVQTVNRDGTMLVEGLKEGEKIVVSGVRHLDDGQKVNVLKMPSSSNVGGLL